MGCDSFFRKYPFSSSPDVIRFCRHYIMISYTIYSILLFTFKCSSTNALLELQLHYRMKENEAVGHFVKYVPSDAISGSSGNSGGSDSGSSSSSSNSLSSSSGFQPDLHNYEYRLGSDNEYFSLDLQSGVLRNKVSLDLEQFCASPFSDPSCTLSGTFLFQLAVNVWRENKFVAVIQISITLEDINDNDPMWREGNVTTIRLKEVITRAGFIINLPKAVDSDVSSKFHNITYAVEMFSEYFQFLVVNDNMPCLKLLRDLDYEDRSIHNVTLKAWNPMYPLSSARLLVLILVIDVNDNQPFFSAAGDECLVPENTAIGSIIYTVSLK
jgi:hypothetical protein